MFNFLCQPTGKILATGSKTGVVRFWSMESNISPSRPPEADTMEERHTNEVLVMKFSPSGKYLISGGIDSVSSFFMLQTLQPFLFVNGYSFGRKYWLGMWRDYVSNKFFLST